MLRRQGRRYLFLYEQVLITTTLLDDYAVIDKRANHSPRVRNIGTFTRTTCWIGSINLRQTYRISLLITGIYMLSI